MSCLSLIHLVFLSNQPGYFLIKLSRRLIRCAVPTLNTGSRISSHGAADGAAVAPEVADPGAPELHGEVVVRGVAGGVLDAVSADEVPEPARDDVGGPGGAAPVRSREPGEGRRQVVRAEGPRGPAEVMGRIAGGVLPGRSNFGWVRLPGSGAVSAWPEIKERVQ